MRRAPLRVGRRRASGGGVNPPPDGIGNAPLRASNAHAGRAARLVAVGSWRRLAVVLIVGAALAVVIAGAAARLAPRPVRREAGLNVLLITIDTLRADALGAYGDARAESREAIAYATRPARVKLFQMMLRVADSAQSVRAPPETIKLRITAADTLP